MPSCVTTTIPYTSYLISLYLSITHPRTITDATLVYGLNRSFSYLMYGIPSFYDPVLLLLEILYYPFTYHVSPTYSLPLPSLYRPGCYSEGL